MNPGTNNKLKTVLIVDDDSINQRLLFFHLKELTNNILFARDGSEAVRQYQAHPDISLILMDMRMPVMNGVEASVKIHEMDAEAKIVALSAYAEDETDFGSQRSIFTDYLTKPINKDVLIKTVSKYL